VSPNTRTHGARNEQRASLSGLAVALVASVVLLGTLFGTASAATVAWVDTGGDCLQMRTAPGLNSSNIRCLGHGTQIALRAGVQPLDGFTWQEMEYEGQVGWVANYYITTDQDAVQTIFEPVDPTSSGLAVPPVGGVTMGVTTATDPAALAAAQGYEVAGIWHLDIPTQTTRQFIPGAPAFVNSLTSLPANAVVTVRRAGTLTGTGALPEASLTVAGTPNVLRTPPVNGLTQGVSGTTDPKFLVQAQPFTVTNVYYFHVDSQRWLVHVPGAPDYVNSLRQGQLRVDSVVTVRRGEDAPNPPPTSTNSTYFETSITYYYCVPGTNPDSIGDAGGYCGVMANGERVYAGAAACAPGLLGQRFTIEGDPTGRIYTCADSGGSVLNDHRDIWFMHSDEGYDWWVTVGSRAYITILPD